MKVREAMKRLNDEGWTIARQKGDHRQYTHPDKPGRRVTISGHPRDEMDPKTRGSVAGQAGWDKEGDNNGN